MLLAMHESSLVRLAERFAAASGISLSRVAFLAVDDGKFFSRLQAGRTCTLRSARNVIEYLSHNWPDGAAEWPGDIPRPAPRPDGEGAAATLSPGPASPPLS